MFLALLCCEAGIFQRQRPAFAAAEMPSSVRRVIADSATAVQAPLTWVEPAEVG